MVGTLGLASEGTMEAENNNLAASKKQKNKVNISLAQRQIEVRLGLPV